ncbi:MAG: prephenate/arogenate dehydrogenase family protein [Sphingopyxis sp.]
MTRAAPFARITIIGLGLIGSSIARAVAVAWPDTQIVGYDVSDVVRERVSALGLCNQIFDNAVDSARSAELVILAVPVGATQSVASSLIGHVPPDAIISDVGSSKASVAAILRNSFPDHSIVPAHPVAGTESSGPDAGFASLFRGRWCILTPDADTPETVIARVSALWAGVGAKVEIMDAQHHDMVLAVTSHLPHLIAYTIVGTASDLEGVTTSDVIKYSAGGFRDFTRIAASDPVMWRDVFLSNRDAVLDMLQRFSEDLSQLQRAIRWGDGDTLHALFSRTRAIRRSIVEQGQDDAAPDFGRKHS